MLIIAVDNDPTMLRDAEQAIRKAEPEAELMCFGLADDALEAIRAQALSPDIVFSDIEMPGINGLEFAVALRTVSPDTRIVFVTAHSQYALVCLLRNLYAGQEATVRTGHGTTDWFQIGKGVRQGCILSLC